MQLQCTLSFMRQNDKKGIMSAKSFEHCIDQVVRFHFPYKRNLQYSHWNARKSTRILCGFVPRHFLLLNL